MGIVNLNGEVTREKSIIRVDGDTPKNQLLFLGNDTGDIGDNTKVIISHHAESDAILRLSLTAPPCLDYSIAEA